MKESNCTLTSQGVFAEGFNGKNGRKLTLKRILSHFCETQPAPAPPSALPPRKLFKWNSLQLLQ